MGWVVPLPSGDPKKASLVLYVILFLSTTDYCWEGVTAPSIGYLWNDYKDTFPV